MPRNALVFEISHKYACKDLVEFATVYTPDAFEEVAQNEIGVNKLADIISADELNVTSEEQVCEAAMRANQ